MLKLFDTEDKLCEKNRELADELSSLGIKKLQISSIGNSIATGFSAMSANKPLLQRNETLPFYLESRNIDLEQHQFSRFENNSDEHTFNNFVSNKSENEINRECRRDYRHFRMNGKEMLPEDKILEYYPMITDSKGMADTIYESGFGLANVVVANVGTGAFLDNWTRGGKHLLTNGIAKDRSYIEAILGLIQLNNRTNYANAQVYLCGAPRILNTPITDIFINRPLKSVAKRYANVTYVPNISRKILYPNDVMGMPFPDTHYNEEEYLRLLLKIEESIISEYQMHDSLITIDRSLASLSREIEMFGEERDSRDEILSIIETEVKRIEDSGKNSEEFLNKVIKYLLERYPYDFYFLDKKAITDSKKVLIKR